MGRAQRKARARAAQAQGSARHPDPALRTGVKLPALKSLASSPPVVCVDYSQQDRHVTWGAAVILDWQRRPQALTLGGIIDPAQLEREQISGEAEAQQRCAQALLQLGITHAYLFTDEYRTAGHLKINLHNRDTPLGTRAHQAAGLMRIHVSGSDRARPSECWSPRASDWATRGFSQPEQLQLARLAQGPLKLSDLGELSRDIDEHKRERLEKKKVKVPKVPAWRGSPESTYWLQKVELHFKVPDRARRQGDVEIQVGGGAVARLSLCESFGDEQGGRERRSRRELQHELRKRNMLLSEEDYTTLNSALWTALRSVPRGPHTFCVRAYRPHYHQRISKS